MRKIAALPVLAALVAVLATAGTVQARTPACNGTKIDPVASGTYMMPFGTSVGSVTITVTGHDSGATFAFHTDAATHVVTSLAVKGGPVDPLVYTPNTSSGSGYHSPYNPSSGTWYGLSYLCFQTAEAPADGGGGPSE